VAKLLTRAIILLTRDIKRALSSGRSQTLQNSNLEELRDQRASLDLVAIKSLSPKEIEFAKRIFDRQGPMRSKRI